MRRTKKEIMSGTDCDRSKVIDHNTIEYFVGDIRVIRLHLTDILIFKPDGSVAYNSGGWKTVTTKDRLNKFGPARIWQAKNIWYLAYVAPGTAQRQESIFYDGITCNPAIGIVDIKTEDKASKKWLKLIDKYCKKLSELDRLPVPSGSDCWSCALFDQNLEAGEKSTSRDHLESHLTEGYIHGSLIFNALKWAGYREPAFIFQVDYRNNIARCVKRYFKANLGIAG